MKKYLPSNAGQSIINVVHDRSAMQLWTRFFLFLDYAVTAAAALVLVRQDA